MTNSFTKGRTFILVKSRGTRVSDQIDCTIVQDEGIEKVKENPKNMNNSIESLLANELLFIFPVSMVGSDPKEGVEPEYFKQGGQKYEDKEWDKKYL